MANYFDITFGDLTWEKQEQIRELVSERLFDETGEEPASPAIDEEIRLNFSAEGEV